MHETCISNTYETSRWNCAQLYKLVKFVIIPTKSSTILRRADAIDLKCVKTLCEDKCFNCNSNRPSISVINNSNIQRADKK